MNHLLRSIIVTVVASVGTRFSCAAQTLRETPTKVAFYYGFPSLVNGAGGDVDTAANIFAEYGVVVLGDGVEFATTVKRRNPPGVGRAEYQRTKALLRALHERDSRTQFFGYVCVGNTQSLSAQEINRRIGLWKRLGVSGIFFDEAGFDWPIVTRARQNAAIRTAHGLGLKAFVNAYYPASLLDEPEGEGKRRGNEPTALTSGDAILLESFPVRTGNFEPTEEWRERLDQALAVRSRSGAQIVTLATSDAGRSLEEEQLEYACWNAWMFDFDGIAWGEPKYASDNHLPERTCTVLSAPPTKGRRHAAAAAGQQVFLRETSNGVVVLNADSKTVHLQRTEAGSLQEVSPLTRCAAACDANSR